MPQKPAATSSPGLQQDSVPPSSPTMPPPEVSSEGQQSSHSHSPVEESVEEEFQFLNCQGCQTQAKCPKLLPCLHTLCSTCLEAPSLQCPICQVPQLAGSVQALDNVFFESLQRRLMLYQQIMDAQATCTRCREPADSWCFECEQLLCTKCFEAHQWFLKHEARPLAELRQHSAHEFLDGTRKSNNIFCSNPNHRNPTQTSLYCRGCSKPLCCSCAILDSDHGDLRCDISMEIQQWQSELDVMARALQEQDGSFGAVREQVSSAIRQLGHARTETEEQIRAQVRQVVAYVQAREQELLEAVQAQYQRDYEGMARRLSRLDAVLQRIRVGGTLVQRMKRYASDQEMLDMHGFLREALCRLRQEEPQHLQSPVRTDSFDEIKVRLQDLISCIPQGTDAALSKRVISEGSSMPSDSSVSNQPSEAQKAQAKALGLSEAQPAAVVQLVPREPSGPIYAFSIRSPSSGEVSNEPSPKKRKSCQTQCSRKVIKLESEEDKELPLDPSPSEQPRPSTSRAVSPPHLDRPAQPESPSEGKEVLQPNNTQVTSVAAEADEPIVVISSSEDSDAENLPLPCCREHKGPPISPQPHAAPQLGLPSILSSLLQPPAPSVPASLMTTRSSLPSFEGSTSACTGPREPSAFTASSATIRPLYNRLCRPPWPRLPSLSPQCLPGVRTTPRSLLAACERSSTCPTDSGQRHPAAVPSRDPPSRPSSSTGFFPSSPSQPPIVMSFPPGDTGGLSTPSSRGRGSPRGFGLQVPAPRMPLQLHLHHRTNPRDPSTLARLPRARPVRAPRASSLYSCYPHLAARPPALGPSHGDLGHG
ncbi:protein PML isoform X2 [Octodon degus]|uniref:Protein PML n=1 Tax=Octodon degus TaxID=10160 RepID=A0A6P6E7N9_OCTDE|nr:protein PML isoform X2 [Octodon degus]